jgi:hypothetical protein
MVAFFERATAFVDRATGQLTTSARDWLLAVITDLNQASLRKQIAAQENQAAAISSTPIDLGDVVPGGYYRVSVYLRLTQAASSNSSVTPTVSWVENGQARSVSGTAYTGNALAGAAQPFAPVIKIDANTDISYSVAYASVGATPMRFSADVIVERLPEMPS